MAGPGPALRRDGLTEAYLERINALQKEYRQTNAEMAQLTLFMGMLSEITQSTQKRIAELQRGQEELQRRWEAAQNKIRLDNEKLRQRQREVAQLGRLTLEGSEDPAAMAASAAVVEE